MITHFGKISYILEKLDLDLKSIFRWGCWGEKKLMSKEKKFHTESFQDLPLKTYVKIETYAHQVSQLNVEEESVSFGRYEIILKFLITEQ